MRSIEVIGVNQIGDKIKIDVSHTKRIMTKRINIFFSLIFNSNNWKNEDSKENDQRFVTGNPAQCTLIVIVYALIHKGRWSKFCL